MTFVIDVFIDLGHVESPIESLRVLLQTWSAADHLSALIGRVTVALPESSLAEAAGADWLPEGATATAAGDQMLRSALIAAAQAQRPLLTLHGIVDISPEAVSGLNRALSADPMVGFAVPRLACRQGCCVARVPRHGLGATTWIGRDVLLDENEFDLLPEIAAPCLLVSAEVAGNLQEIDDAAAGWPARLLRYVAAARRCGFRVALCHRILCHSASGCDDPVTPIAPALSAADRLQMAEAVPDIDRAWDEFRGGSLERFEILYGARAPRRPDDSRPQSRPSLLLDLRNLGPIFNGTTYALLGLARGLRALAPPWDIAIVAQPPAIAAHDLKAAFPGWPIHREIPARGFTVAFRPSQPWHPSELFDLHRSALFNACVVLDTIAWDVVYAAPPALDGTWRFLAEHADALLFDSEYTRQRFLYRFPAHPDVSTAVTLLSCDPREATSAEVSPGEGDYLLVIGNHLDHKDVPRTVETLATAFPYLPIRALGLRTSRWPTVTALESGNLPEAALHQLYARARWVVFPSFYEGFGFPIVTALAYGRTVLARRSALLDEVAGECAPRGRLIEYGTREDLVRILGRLHHGDAVEEKPIGQRLGSRAPRSWRDVAAETMLHLEGLLTSRRHHWWRRERAVRQSAGVRD